MSSRQNKTIKIHHHKITENFEKLNAFPKNNLPYGWHMAIDNCFDDLRYNRSPEIYWEALGALILNGHLINDEERKEVARHALLPSPPRGRIPDQDRHEAIVEMMLPSRRKKNPAELTGLTSEKAMDKIQILYFKDRNPEVKIQTKVRAAVRKAFVKARDEVNQMRPGYLPEEWFDKKPGRKPKQTRVPPTIP